MRTDLEMLARANEMLAEAVSFVGDDMLGAPTPCPAWDVAALLDHVIGGNRFTVHILDGHTAEEALAAAKASFTVDTQAQVAVVESASAQLAAFDRPNVMAGTYHHAAGDLTGEEIIRLRIHDMCIHVWDLLIAVNPKKGLDPVYVRWAIKELATAESLTARHMATGYRNPTKSYELLLAFGRRRVATADHLRRNA